MLRGPRPRAGSIGLAHALDTFRAQLEKHRAKQESDLHHSDPRIGLHDDELAEAAEFVAALARALAPLESIAEQSRRLSEIAGSHRKVVAALSRQDGEEVAFAGPDGAKLADALDELATSNAAAASAWSIRPTMSSSSPRHSPTGWCGRRRVQARACVFWAPSKRGSPTATASCSGAWSKGPGRRKAAPMAGSAGRCGSISGSICRSGASA